MKFPITPHMHALLYYTSEQVGKHYLKSVTKAPDLPRLIAGKQKWWIDPAPTPSYRPKTIILHDWTFLTDPLQTRRQKKACLECLLSGEMGDAFDIWVYNGKQLKPLTEENKHQIKVELLRQEDKHQIEDLLPKRITPRDTLLAAIKEKNLSEESCLLLDHVVFSDLLTGLETTPYLPISAIGSMMTYYNLRSPDKLIEYVDGILSHMGAYYPNRPVSIRAHSYDALKYTSSSWKALQEKYRDQIEERIDTLTISRKIFENIAQASQREIWDQDYFMALKQILSSKDALAKITHIEIHNNGERSNQHPGLNKTLKDATQCETLSFCGCIEDFTASGCSLLVDLRHLAIRLPKAFFTASDAIPALASRQLTSLKISSGYFVDLSEILEEDGLPELRVLSLNIPDLDPIQLGTLLAMSPLLEELTLSIPAREDFWTEALAKEIHSSPPLTHLKTLNLSCDHEAVERFPLELCAHSLEELTLTGHFVIPPTSHMPHLKSLKLSHINLATEELHAILSHSRKISFLQANWCILTGTLSPLLLPALKTLKLADGGIHLDTFTQLLNGTRQLQTCKFTASLIDTSPLPAKLRPLPHLEHLSLDPSGRSDPSRPHASTSWYASLLESTTSLRVLTTSSPDRYLLKPLARGSLEKLEVLVLNGYWRSSLQHLIRYSNNSLREIRLSVYEGTPQSKPTFVVNTPFTAFESVCLHVHLDAPLWGLLASMIDSSDCFKNFEIYHSDVSAPSILQGKRLSKIERVEVTCDTSTPNRLKCSQQIVDAMREALVEKQEKKTPYNPEERHQSALPSADRGAQNNEVCKSGAAQTDKMAKMLASLIAKGGGGGGKGAWAQETRENEVLSPYTIKPRQHQASIMGDANTQQKSSFISEQTSRKIYAFNGHHPDPREYRQDFYHRFTVNMGESSIDHAFHLEHISPAVVRIIDIPQTKEDLRQLGAFQQAKTDNQTTFYARDRLFITATWTPLLSLSAEDEITYVKTQSDADYEIAYCSENRCYLIRSRTEGTQTITLEYLFQHPLVCQKPEPRIPKEREDLQAITALIAELNTYGAGALDLTGCRAGIDYLQAMMAQKKGSCRHRAFVLKHLMDTQYRDYHTRVITNECYAFVEISIGGTVLRCDLGGYPMPHQTQQDALPIEDFEPFVRPSQKSDFDTPLVPPEGTAAAGEVAEAEPAAEADENEAGPGGEPDAEGSGTAEEPEAEAEPAAEADENEAGPGGEPDAEGSGTAEEPEAEAEPAAEADENEAGPGGEPDAEGSGTAEEPEAEPQPQEEPEAVEEPEAEAEHQPQEEPEAVEEPEAEAVEEPEAEAVEEPEAEAVEEPEAEAVEEPEAEAVEEPEAEAVEEPEAEAVEEPEAEAVEEPEAEAEAEHQPQEEAKPEVEPGNKPLETTLQVPISEEKKRALLQEICAPSFAPKLSQHLSQAEKISRLLREPGQKHLLLSDGNDAHQASLLEIYQNAKDSGYPVFLVRSPDDLTLHLGLIKQADNTGVRTQEASGPLHDFLNALPENGPTPILLIDFSHFTQHDVIRSNSLADETRRLEKIELPPRLTLIGCQDTSLDSCYTGSDLYRRYTCNDNHNIKRSTDSNLFAQQEGDAGITINLYHNATEAESWLRGRWTLDRSLIRYRDGQLIQALKAAREAGAEQPMIKIINAPLNDPGYRLFWEKAAIDGEIDGVPIDVNRIIHDPEPQYDQVDVLETAEMAFSEAEEKRHCLNPESFSAFFVHYTEEGHELLDEPGLLQQAHCDGNDSLPVLVTHSLKRSQWAELLDKASTYGIALDIRTLPDVPAILPKDGAIPPPLECEKIEFDPASPNPFIASTNIEQTVRQLMKQKPEQAARLIQEMVRNKLIEPKKQELAARITQQFAKPKLTEAERLNKLVAFLVSTAIKESVQELNKNPEQAARLIQKMVRKKFIEPKKQEQAEPASEAFSLYHSTCQVLDVSELEGTDLFLKMDAEVDPHNIVFTQKKQAILRLLEGTNKTIILTGHFSDALVGTLLPYIRRYPNRLFCVTDSPKVFGRFGCQTHAVPTPAVDVKAFIRLDDAGMLSVQPFSGAEKAAAASEAFFEQRKQVIGEALANHPYVFISGLTGVGKSTFIQKYHPHALWGDEKLSEWADNPAGGVLFLDEANINSRQWTEFEGLFNDPQSLLIDGEIKYLTADHKVIFAGNPLKAGGARQLARLFKHHGHAVVFQPLTADVIYHDILRPIASGTLLQDRLHELAPPLLEAYNEMVSLSRDKILVTPRQLKLIMMMTLSACEEDPDLDPAAVLNDKARVVLLPLLDERNHWCLNQIFPARPLAAAAAAEPIERLGEGFWVTESRRPALNCLNDLLRIRRYQAYHHDVDLNADQARGGICSLVLEGMPGTGKTQLAQALMQEQDFREAQYDAEGVLLPGQPFNTYHMIPPTLSLAEKISRLIQAFKAGHVVIMDEVNASPMMEDLINELLMGTYQGVPAPHPGFMLLGTQNPFSMGYRQKESTAQNKRMIKIEVPEYPADEMIAIAEKLYGIPRLHAEVLVELYEKTKNVDPKRPLTFSCFLTILAEYAPRADDVERMLQQTETIKQTVDARALTRRKKQLEDMAAKKIQTFFRSSMRVRAIEAEKIAKEQQRLAEEERRRQAEAAAEQQRLAEEERRREAEAAATAAASDDLADESDSSENNDAPSLAAVKKQRQEKERRQLTDTAATAAATEEPLAADTHEHAEEAQLQQAEHPPTTEQHTDVAVPMKHDARKTQHSTTHQVGIEIGGWIASALFSGGGIAATLISQFLPTAPTWVLVLGIAALVATIPTVAIAATLTSKRQQTLLFSPAAYLGKSKSTHDPKQ